MKYVTRFCPICGRKEAERAIKSKSPAEGLQWAEVAEHWRGLFKDKSFFSYWRCGNCRVLFCPEYFSEDQLGELYRSMDANMSEVPAPSLEKTQYGYFKDVRQYCAGSGGYLELGPDIGYFTSLCTREGRFDAHWLVEPNRQVWPQLRSALREDSEPTLFADLSDIDRIPQSSITFAAAIHVLDHLLDPVAVLKRIREKMDNNSYVMSVTHDEQSTLARVLGARWPAFCLQHPQLYSADSIRELFRAADFEVVSIKKSVNYFPLGFLIRQGLWSTVRVDIEFFKQLDVTDVGLRLGNILTIAKPAPAGRRVL